MTTRVECLPTTRELFEVAARHGLRAEAVTIGTAAAHGLLEADQPRRWHGLLTPREMAEVAADRLRRHGVHPAA